MHPNVSLVNRIERGIRNPPLKVIKKIANTLGVNTEAKEIVKKL